MPTTTVTKYYSVNGRIIGEKVGSNPRTDYLTDALGSVTATVDQNAQIVNTYRYKPYGAQLSKTGTGPDPAFRWVGSFGYRQTGLTQSDVYVRARHYGTATGRWTNTDPMLSLLGSHFVEARPSDRVDPSGLLQMPKCPDCCPTGDTLPDPNHWCLNGTFQKCTNSSGASKRDCDEALKSLSARDCESALGQVDQWGQMCLQGTTGGGGVANYQTKCCEQAPDYHWKFCNIYCCSANDPRNRKGIEACSAYCLYQHERMHGFDCKPGWDGRWDEHCAYYVAATCLYAMIKEKCGPPPENYKKCLARWGDVCREKVPRR